MGRILWCGSFSPASLPRITRLTLSPARAANCFGIVEGKTSHLNKLINKTKKRIKILIKLEDVEDFLHCHFNIKIIFNSILPLPPNQDSHREEKDAFRVIKTAFVRCEKCFCLSHSLITRRLPSHVREQLKRSIRPPQQSINDARFRAVRFIYCSTFMRDESCRCNHILMTTSGCRLAGRLVVA